MKLGEEIAVWLLLCDVVMKGGVLSVPYMERMKECSLSVDGNGYDFEGLQADDDAFLDKEVESVKPSVNVSCKMFYDVEYALAGYTDVAIQDNIFLNPIGCMYDLNPEG